MELLILVLLSSTTLAQGKTDDPNDEPFLPIYPVYPYSPKLIKRGTEHDGVTHLTPELYTSKVEGRETYNTNLGTNYPRDPYYPAAYNPYPKATTSFSYTPYYGTSSPYSYTGTPYNVYNSYTTPYSVTPSYSTLPYSSQNYPGYYYQTPYYYPTYTQPLFPPPPPPPGFDYSNYRDPYTEAGSSDQDKEKKLDVTQKSKDTESSQDASGGQFVDGGNYISGNSKDLDSQPSTQKAASPYNQLDQVSEISLKDLQLPLPKTTYRVISVAGQPVGPDYPLPAPYVRAQQLEQLMSQTMARLLAQQTAQQQQNNQYIQHDANQNVLPKNTNQQQYVNNYKDTQPQYVSIPNVIAKTGLAYVINPNLLGKLTAAQANGQTVPPPTTLTKSTNYAPTGLYVTTKNEEKDQPQVHYDTYDNNQATAVAQDYDDRLGAPDNKQSHQSYDTEENQSTVHQTQNYVTERTHATYTHQYPNYTPSRVSLRPQSQKYQGNFGAKRANKG